MTDRQGIEIDYCPQCRGVWLDRGELDKIIDRSMTVAPPGSGDYRQESRSGQYRDEPYPRKKRKREGFLSDLFDFG